MLGEPLRIEREIIERCQRGDSEAFRWLVDRYGDLAYRTAYFMVYDRQQAEDITQEAFLDAWRGIKGFKVGYSFKPWFLKIVVNRCRMQKRHRVVPTVSLERVEPKRVATGARAADEAVASGESRQLVREAIASLEEDQRSVIMLRYFAELTVPEIAQVLSLPEGTVKSRLHRAMQRLRHRLSPLMGFEIGRPI